MDDDDSSDEIMPMWMDDNNDTLPGVANSWTVQQQQAIAEAHLLQLSLADANRTIFSHLSRQPLTAALLLEGMETGEVWTDDNYPPVDDNDPSTSATADTDDLLQHDSNSNIDEDNLPFIDQMHGLCTPEEQLSLRVLKLLRSYGAPNRAYDQLMEIFIDASQANVSLSPILHHRSTALKHFAKRFSLQSLYPIIHTKHMGDRSYPVVRHLCRAMIDSLLYSSLFQEDNLLFVDPSNPLAAPLPESEMIGDIVTGKAYARAHRRLCTNPNDLLCPLIFYLDKLSIDRHGHLSLEGLYFTLGLFKRPI